MMSSMKDSGVEWIGEIPVEWEVNKYRYAAKVDYGFPADSTLFNNEGIGVPLIRIRDITSGQIATWYSGTYPKNLLVQSGDILVGMDGDFGLRTWKGPDALLNQRCCRIKGGVLNGRFLFYCMAYPLNVLGSLMISTTVKHLLSSDIANITLPVAPMNEQIAIVSYLDSKCARIDAAASALAKQISLLERYRASVIHEAVTCGLDSTVPTKPSGVDWMGDIPKGWNCNKIKNVTTLKTGKTPDTAEQERYYDGAVDWFTPGDLSDAPVSSAEKTITTQAIKDGAGFIIPKNSVLLVAIGATAGKTGYLEINAATNQQITALIPRATFAGKYLFYVLMSMRQRMNDLALFATVPILNNQYIGGCTIPEPPYRVQRTIADYLDARTSAIDVVLDTKRKQLDILKRRRQSLIYEFVTGKRRVNMEA